MKNIKDKNIIVPAIILGIIAFFIINSGSLNLPEFLAPQTYKARDLYRKAADYQKSNDYKTAYFTYSKIPKSYIAYDVVLFQQSKCALELEDEKTVIEKLKTLLSRFSKSPLASQASYNLGQAYVRTGENEKAEKQFLKTIRNYPDTNYALGSYYYIGQINKDKNQKLAAKYWLDYISLAKDGRFTLDCIEGIKSLKYNLSAQDKKNIAIALFIAQRHNESLKYLAQIPIQKSWYYLGKNYASLGDKARALFFIKEGIKKYSVSLDKEELEDAMSLYVNLSTQQPDKSWSDLVSIPSKSIDFAMFQKAQISPENDAQKLYYEIINYHPDSFFASEALWNIFWDKFNNGNYEQAIKLGKKHIANYKNTKASPKIIFWTAKAYERINQKHTASNYYEKLLSLYPDSYYAFRANGRLKAIKTGKDPGWKTNRFLSLNEVDSQIPNPYSYDEIKKNHNIQVSELVNLEDYDTALSIIEEDPFLESWLKLKEGHISKSIVSARDGMNKLMPKPGPEDKRWKLIYPLYFAEDINHYAKINSLDPVIVLSLLKEESYFNPLAVSSSNARGLMQLLPGTAQDIARWAELGSVSEIQLFNPKINIKLGTAYIKHAKERLNNNILFAVAGYNGGPGAVEKWLKTIPNADIDQFIENIPYNQTRDYIKKVYGSYWNYKRIYELD